MFIKILLSATALLLLPALQAVRPRSNDADEDSYAALDSNDNSGNFGSSAACGLNLNGKTERPRINITTAATSKQRKTKNQVNYSLPSRDDFRAQFKAMDFKMNIRKGNLASGGGGSRLLVTAGEMPALFGEASKYSSGHIPAETGVAMARVDLEPCGLYAPHLHPRATELMFVWKAEQLEVGVLDEQLSSRYVINQLTTGDLTVFPRGHLHYQMNRGCTNATFTPFFNNDDPGFWFAAERLFDLKPDVLATAFDVDETLIKKIRRGSAGNIAKGQEACLQQCASLREESNKKENNY